MRHTCSPDPAGPTFPRIRVGGTSRERGRQYGESARAKVQLACDIYEEIFAHYTGGWTWERARAEAARFRGPIEAFDPRFLEEIVGLAEGAGVEDGDVLALNVRTEIMFAAQAQKAAGSAHRPRPPECSAFGATAGPAVLAGMNWDWVTATSELAIVLESAQAEGPNFVSLTEAGLLAKVGMNSSGFGLVANSLVTEKDVGNPAVPLQILLRALLDSESIHDALATMQRGNRAASCNFLLVHSDGLAVDVEAAAGDFAQLWVGYPEAGLLLHTNHFVNPGFNGRDLSMLSMPDSPTRLQRLRQLAPHPREYSPEAFMEMFADHAMHPHSVCCHAGIRRGDELPWQTLASLIVDVSTRCLYLASGPPCSTPFEHLDYGEFLRESPERSVRA